MSVNELLLYAAKNNHIESVELLLNMGADIDYQGDNDSTALILAAGNGHERIMEILIENRADVNATDAFGDTALKLAALYGHEKIVKLLLETGVNVDYIDDHNGANALVCAVQEGYEKIIKLLIANGANVDVRIFYGRTALMYASFHGHKEIVKLLLERAADIDAQDEDGKTALIIACWRGNPKIVELLLEKNANIDLQDKDGKTALDYVEGSEKKKDFVLMLVESLVCGRRRIQPGDGSVMAEYGGFIEAELPCIAQLRARLFLHVIRNAFGLGEMLGLDYEKGCELKLAYRGASAAAEIGEMGEVCRREALMFERENAYEAIQRHENHGVNSLYEYFMESFVDFEKFKWLKVDLARILGSEKLSAEDVLFALSFVNYDYLGAYEFMNNAPEAASMLGLKEFVDEVKGTARASEILEGLVGEHVARLQRGALGGVAR